VTGIICAVCLDSSNNPTPPRCDRADCPGRQTLEPLGASSASRGHDLRTIVLWLETAAQPDRDIDLAIWNLVFPDEQNPIAPAPEYTSSIERATRLVPLGLNWSLNSKAEARVGGPRFGGVLKGGEHRIPAIAMCIAALKAHGAVTGLVREGGE
jgi:hypothetical protein